MDPTKCLTEILEELGDGAYVATYPADAACRLQTLARWIELGGFPPDVEAAISQYKKEEK